MDAIFIPYCSGSLPVWITAIINCMYSIASSNNCCSQCTLWVPKSFYPLTIVPHCLAILDTMETPWAYCIHEYNTASFGNSISALCIGITIYLKSDIYRRMGNNCLPPLNTPLKYGYDHCIRPEVNLMDDILSIPLYSGSLSDYVPSPLPSLTQPLIIAVLQNDNKLPVVVLHPLYPGREPIIATHQDCHNGVFENSFGVPFQGKDGSTYGRPVSGKELLRCYSDPPPIIIPDNSVWPTPDPILDMLIPGSLPLFFIDSIATSYSIIDRVYSNQTLESDDCSNIASCYLQGKMSFMILD